MANVVKIANRMAQVVTHSPPMHKKAPLTDSQPLRAG